MYTQLPPVSYAGIIIIFLTLFCWLTIAPWSSSTFTVSGCPLQHAFIRAVS
jgi:hypothetical protein